MPNGFFDFTQDPMANSPATGQGYPSWLNQDEPIAPESNDVDLFDNDGGMYDSTSMPQPDVPYGALASINGMRMPQMGPTDSMGRYGVTSDQRAAAGNKGFAQALSGAAAAFLGGGPEAALAGGMRAGDVNSAYLDKYSAQNVAQYKLQAEAAKAAMDFEAKKSDIQRQQGVIEAERMKLEDLKRTRMVAAEFAEKMAPAAQEMIAQAREQYPSKVDALQRGFLTVKSHLVAGDLKAADEQYELTKQLLPGPWQEELDEKIKRRTATELSSQEAVHEMVDALNEKAKAEGSKEFYEMGSDGKVSFISERERQERELKDAAVRANIGQSGALSEKYRAEADYMRAGKPTAAGANKGQISQFQKMAAVEDARTAALFFSNLTNGVPKSDAEKAKAIEHQSKLLAFGVDPSDKDALSRIISAESGVLLDRYDSLLKSKGSSANVGAAGEASGSMGRGAPVAQPKAQSGGRSMPDFSADNLAMFLEDPKVQRQAPATLRNKLLEIARASSDQTVKRAVEKAVKAGETTVMVETLKKLIKQQ